MITSTLAGLRDLRSSLAAGFLWLASAWVLAHEVLWRQVGTRESLVSDSAKLLDQLGTAASLAVVTFVAYLLGSVIAMSRPPAWMRRSLTRMSAETFTEPNLHLAVKWRFHPIAETLFASRRPWTKAYEMAWTDTSILIGKVNPLDLADIVRVPQEVSELVITPADNLQHLSQRHPVGTHRFSVAQISVAVADAMANEIPHLAARLQVTHPDLHNEYGRKLAESELRVAVALPIAALSVVTAWSLGRWWPLAGILFGVILFILGVRKYFEGHEQIWAVVSAGLLESPTLEALRNGIKSLLTSANVDDEGQGQALARSEIESHQQDGAGEIPS